MKKKVAEWLSNRFTPSTLLITRLALFGSVEKGVPNPSDCDILVLTNCDPDSEGWIELKKVLVELEAPFLATFGVPLSVTFLMTSEFASLRRFQKRATPFFDVRL